MYQTNFAYLNIYASVIQLMFIILIGKNIIICSPKVSPQMIKNSFHAQKCIKYKPNKYH